MRKLLVIFAVLVLAASACSSTAKRAVNPGGTESPGGIPTDQGTLPGVAPTGTGPGGAGASGRGGGAGGAGTAPGTYPRLPNGQFDWGPPAAGVTPTEVHIGMWAINAESGCQATGIAPAGPRCDNSDQQQATDYVNYINAHGGVAGGRKLVMDYYITDVSDSTFPGQAQAACEHFTNDAKVLAVISEGTVGRDFMAHCLHDNHIPDIEPGFWPFDATERSQLYPYLYQPNRPAPERWVTAYIVGLVAQNYFQGGTLGLVRTDGGAFDRVTANVLKPRLAKYHITLADEERLSATESLSDYGQWNSQIGNAILRMKRKNINRVIFFSTYGEIAAFWFKQANAAKFRPRYGMSSMDSYVNDMNGGGPQQQFVDAVGVGWWPEFDVQPAQDPGGSSQAALCATLDKKSGRTDGVGRNTRCDSIFWLRYVLSRAPALNALGIRAAVEGIGSSYHPSNTFTDYFAPGRYDGPASLRYIEYDITTCGCFRYTSGLHPM